MVEGHSRGKLLTSWQPGIRESETEREMRGRGQGQDIVPKGVPLTDSLQLGPASYGFYHLPVVQL